MSATYRPIPSTDWLWLAAAVWAGLFLGLHAVPLFDLDEGAFSEATREMFARGDFLSTYLNGQPRFDKPILVYWLQAASVAVLGLNELAVRLPSALAATAWVAATFAFARRVRDADTAWHAAAFTATALQISLIGRAAIADALLNLWLATTMYAVFLYAREPRARWLYLAWAGMGLGFLTKGPVAVLVPAVTSLLYFAREHRLREWWRAVAFVPGIAVFIALALPWYAWQYAQHGRAFIDGFFLTHNIGRFGGPMQGHGGSLVYYVPVLLIGLLPYSGLLVTLLRRLRTTWRDPLGGFALIWFGFVFIFFSLSGTKLPHYLVYGYGGLLVLMAAAAREARSRWLLAPAALYFALLLFAPELLAAALAHTRDPDARAAIAGAVAAFTPAWRAWMLGGLALCAWLAFGARAPMSRRLVAAGVAAALAFGGLVLPLAGEVLQRPVKEAAAIARSSDAPLTMWRINTPSFLFYSERLAARRRPLPGDMALVHSSEMGNLGPYDVLYQRNGIALVKMRAN